MIPEWRWWQGGTVTDATAINRPERSQDGRTERRKSWKECVFLGSCRYYILNRSMAN